MSPLTRGCELKSPPFLQEPFVPVTPHAGVRIEIFRILKQSCGRPVTPHAGVRIEIRSLNFNAAAALVTPHAGVRIEINFKSPMNGTDSHPSRGGAN